MVGGKVIEVLDCGPDTGVWPSGRMWVNCRGTGHDKHKTLAIYVERTNESRSISEGDSIWWQGTSAFWTPKPKDGSEPPFSDRKLKRLSYSGVSRPTEEELQAGQAGIPQADGVPA